jgi:autotransporter-associated beta strand protein
MRLTLRRRNKSQLHLARWVVSVVLVFAVTALHAAATYTWSGLGAYDDWAVPDNWLGPPNSYYPGFLALDDNVVLPADSQGYMFTQSSRDIEIGSIDVSASYTIDLTGDLTLNQSVTGSGLTITDDGSLYFYSSASAGDTIINVNNDGALYFVSAASAGTAAITNAGQVFFYHTATGTNASLVLKGGILDVSNMTAPLTLGSLSDTAASPGTLTLGSTSLTLASSANETFWGVIQGSGTLTQAGTGTLTIAGSGSYSGGFVVNAGVLDVEGSLTAAPVSVTGSTSLSGGGQVGAVTLGNGELIPGGSAGTSLHMASLSCTIGKVAIDLDISTSLAIVQALQTAQCPALQFSLSANQPIPEGHAYTLVTLASGTNYAETNLGFTAPAGYEVKVSVETNAIIARLYLTADEIFPDGFE